MSDSAVATPALGEPLPEPTRAATSTMPGDDGTGADGTGFDGPGGDGTGSAGAPIRSGRAQPSVPPLFGSRPALLLALASGLLLTLAFPGYGLWPMAPLAVTGLALATRGRRARLGALAGFAFGLGFFVPHLHWSGIYVGALPWLALATVESLYLAVMGALLPRIWRVPGGPAGTALAGAGLWVAQEAVRGRLPFGGFPWGRLAFSQAEAPTVGLAAIGGAPLVTAAVGAAGTLLAIAAVALVATLRNRATVSPAPASSSAAGTTTGSAPDRTDGGPRAVAAALVATLAVLALGLAVPLPTSGTTTRVAAVQGNVPQAGLDFNAQRRAVLDDHVRETLKLAAQVRAGTSNAPDLVIWPENSSDIDPLTNPDAAAEINQAVAAVRAPLMVGTVIEAPKGYLSNTSIVWRPGTGPGTGDDSVYVKRHPAPFAEYIPYRSFFRHFSKKVDLVRTDFISGNKLRSDPVGVLRMGSVRVGDVICFEVAYDGLVRDPVKQGATLLAVQTNNATFGHSAESVQQLAMSQLRAVETGRTVVHISTVGISAIILPDGTLEQRSGSFTPAVLEADVPLRTTLTVATRVGAWPEGVLAGAALALILAGALGRRTKKRKVTAQA